MFAFRPLAEADLALLHGWMRRPHVAEWWRGERTLADLRATYLPRLRHEADARPCIALMDDEPFGYIQWYVAMDFGTGWWAGWHDPGILGIDQFIADAGHLGRGLGTALVGAFTAKLFQDPAIHRIVVDPSPDNLRAIRCYEKAGFRAASRIVTPDGPALLMALDRHPRRGVTGPRAARRKP